MNTQPPQFDRDRLFTGAFLFIITAAVLLYGAVVIQIITGKY